MRSSSCARNTKTTKKGQRCTQKHRFKVGFVCRCATLYTISLVNEMGYRPTLLSIWNLFIMFSVEGHTVALSGAVESGREKIMDHMAWIEFSHIS